MTSKILQLDDPVGVVAGAFIDRLHDHGWREYGTQRLRSRPYEPRIEAFRESSDGYTSDIQIDMTDWTDAVTTVLVSETAECVMIRTTSVWCSESNPERFDVRVYASGAAAQRKYGRIISWMELQFSRRAGPEHRARLDRIAARLNAMKARERDAIREVFDRMPDDVLPRVTRDDATSHLIRRNKTLIAVDTSDMFQYLERNGVVSGRYGYEYPAIRDLWPEHLGWAI